MPAKAAKKKSKLGSWAFLIGVILAVILGALGAITPVIATVLIILGIIVGLLNITAEEVTPFLLASTVLVVVSYLGGGVFKDTIGWAYNMLNGILTMFVPAAIIVAIKEVFSLAKQ